MGFFYKNNFAIFIHREVEIVVEIHSSIVRDNLITFPGRQIKAFKDVCYNRGRARHIPNVWYCNANKLSFSGALVYLFQS